MTLKNKPAQNTPFNPESTSASSSLVARAGQIMALIIALGLISMISSMLVTESLSGDAAQINRAGALRMQATRISRAHLIDKSANKAMIATEVNTFEKRLSHLFSGGLTSARDNPVIEAQYQRISGIWEKFKQSAQTTSIHSFDQFVSEIDRLVTLLQLESEKKLRFLRLIQGISLFSVIIVAFVVLIRLNRVIVAPLKQLVKVAEKAGKGNFELKAEYDGDNELGVLARTINQMSEELKSTYQDFEDRVAQKTKELTRSNHSLEALYHAASNLASNEYHQTDQQIINELEAVLGLGKVSIERNDQSADNMMIGMAPKKETIGQPCFNRHVFPLEKQTQIYGCLVWQTPKKEIAREWQTQILQAMADIIATAIELQQKRYTENHLLIVEERAVIARELHDSLAQSLSYLKVQMSLLTRKMQKNVSKDQLSETIEDIKQGLNKAYQQLRELLTTFRLKLEDPSIENALQATITEYTAKCRHPIKLDFQLPKNYLSANQKIHVLQIVREALSNVYRHAESAQAGVSVSRNGNKIRVEIWDDGTGLPNNLKQQGHFGLGIMEERAKSLGTLIELQSIEPQGTRVVFEFEH